MARSCNLRTFVTVDGVEGSVCTWCGDPKPFSEFGNSKNNFRGKKPWCLACSRSAMARVKHKYRSNKNKQSREARAALRLEVLTHYSKGVVPECDCCGEQTLEFLSVDHINGGGSKHKRAVRHVYHWLKKNGFPEGFRDLCHNCNQALGAYGYCPHENQRRTDRGC